MIEAVRLGLSEQPLQVLVSGIGCDRLVGGRLDLEGSVLLEADQGNLVDVPGIFEVLLPALVPRLGRLQFLRILLLVLPAAPREEIIRGLEGLIINGIELVKLKRLIDLLHDFL